MNSIATNVFYSTYCSSGQPAGQWYKHPTRSHRSRDTSGHSRAPSRATTTISRIRANIHNNLSSAVCVHDSGFTFPLSMHKSSVCITSELQDPHKKIRLVITAVAGINREEEMCIKVCLTFLLHQRWTGWQPGPVLPVGPAETERNTEAADPRWALTRVERVLQSVFVYLFVWIPISYCITLRSI